MTLMSRRTLLENTAKGGVALSAGTLLAACGSSSSSSSSVIATGNSTTSGASPKHGTLHAGLTGGSSSDTLDPNLALNNLDYARVSNLYESLVWSDANATIYLRLAEEMTPNKDATVWTIRLRPGLEFHNGQDVTADDLIYSIKRMVNPKSPGVAANALNGIDAAGMKKLDSRTIQVPFSKPYSTLIESLSGVTTVYVVPVGFNPKAPIGTGPFKYQSFTPGQQSVFVRNENYWNQPLPYLDTLIMTDYSDETSQVNALLSSQADAINVLSQETIGTVTGSGKKVVISPGGGWNPFTMRVDAAPLG
jgi:peptide/nickel transport system substrate-binding protein